MKRTPAHRGSFWYSSCMREAAIPPTKTRSGCIAAIWIAWSIASAVRFHSKLKSVVT